MGFHCEHLGLKETNKVNNENQGLSSDPVQQCPIGKNRGPGLEHTIDHHCPLIVQGPNPVESNLSFVITCHWFTMEKWLGLP